MSIDIIVPTRGRPENARRLYDSMLETAVLPDTHMMFVLDGSDPRLGEYLDSGLPQILDYTDSGKNMIERSNAVVQWVHPDILGWMGDDMIFRTKGWDERVVHELTTAPITYANDLFQEHRKAQSVFMLMGMVRSLGWLCPPWSNHLYIDDAWVRLVERLDGTYMSDVVIEHMHPYAKKAEWDDQYRTYNTPDFDTHDGEAYRNWVENGGLDKDVKGVQEWLKNS